MTFDVIPRNSIPLPTAARAASASAPGDLVDFARTRLKFDPDATQERVLRSEAKHALLNCSRQWGKSTICAVKAVHRAYTKPGSLVLAASPTERQSGEFVRKAAHMMGRLGLRPRGDGYNALSLLFPNGSRIVGLPGTEGTVRGFSAASLLIIDEASRVDVPLYEALRPTLAASDGDLWMMSTPNGRQGFFYACWEHGGPGWTRFRAPVTECARIKKEYVERERASMTAAMFAQEYLCEFLDGGGHPFGMDLVEGAMDDDVLPLDLDEIINIWLPKERAR